MPRAERSAPEDSFWDLPAMLAAANGHVDCLRVLHTIGGTAPLLESIEGLNIDIKQLPGLLMDPSFLSLAHKQRWLARELEDVVGRDAGALQLVADRENLLGGLCAQLGVQEHGGGLAAGVQARGLDVSAPSTPPRVTA